MDPYLALKVVFITTFSLIKRHSAKSVNLTSIQPNSHYDIMATLSVSLFGSCHILTKKQKLWRSLAKISLCLTLIQYFTITDDLTATRTYHFDNGIVQSISMDGWFWCFYTFTGRISNGFLQMVRRSGLLR